ESKRKKTIGKKEIEEVIAKMARIPEQTVTLSDKSKLKDLERNLKLLVFGQDQAVESLCSAIKLARSGLREPNKPVGSFLLTEAISKQPHAILLLDEIEKAHPDIFNILLQIMDYGSLTDNNGRIADFRHVTIIMTSNVGASELERAHAGFTEHDIHQDNMAA